MESAIVDRDEWHRYERCRDLWVHLRRQNEVPKALHPALADRLGRRWWASWFEAQAGRSIDSFLRAHLVGYPNKRHCVGEENKAGGEKVKKFRKKYVTATAALRAARESGSPVSKNRESDAYYLCDSCQAFHVGKKPQVQIARAESVRVRLSRPHETSTFVQVEEILGEMSIDTGRIRYADVNRVISEFRLYGEPLHSDDFGDDAYSMVALIIMHLPKLAPVLLEDDRLPDLRSSCLIRLEDGAELLPLDVEKHGLHFGPTLAECATRITAVDDSSCVVDFERYD